MLPLFIKSGHFHRNSTDLFCGALLGDEKRCDFAVRFLIPQVSLKTGGPERLREFPTGFHAAVGARANTGLGQKPG